MAQRRTKLDSRGRIVPIKDDRPTDARLVNISRESEDVERFLIEIGPLARRELSAAASHQRAGQVKVGLFLLFAALDGGEMASLHNNRTIDEIKLAMETPGSVLGERFKEMMRTKLGDEMMHLLRQGFDTDAVETPALEAPSYGVGDRVRVCGHEDHVLPPALEGEIGWCGTIGEVKSDDLYVFEPDDADPVKSVQLHAAQLEPHMPLDEDEVVDAEVVEEDSTCPVCGGTKDDPQPEPPEVTGEDTPGDICTAPFHD